MLYKLIPGSYSYSVSDDQNICTKEDVIFWAEDVERMMNEDEINMLMTEQGIELTREEQEHMENHSIINNDIVKAIDVLEQANEFLEEI